MTIDPPSYAIRPEQAALPPVYRPEQLMSARAGSRHAESRDFSAVLFRLLGFAVVVGIFYLVLLPNLPLIGELLAGLIGDMAEPVKG